MVKEVCQVCHRQKAKSRMLPVQALRDGVRGEILKDFPLWKDQGYICFFDLDYYRSRYVQSLLQEEKGELSQVEESVLKSLHEHNVVTENVNDAFEDQRDFGARIADRVAMFVGSWAFIISFFLFLLFWMGINVWLLSRSFDPYPFILLNLLLSTLAAVQAPLIMMSQNRQEEKDRLRSEYDYKINLKAELEIRQLHEKIDFLLQRQWQRLLEIQEIQLEMMNRHLSREAIIDSVPATPDDDTVLSASSPTPHE